MTKQRIYWMCQIGGWTTWGLLNYVAFFLQSERIVFSDLFGAFFQVVFYIGSTHYLRARIKQKGWFTYYSVKLISLIFGASLLLGLLNYISLLFLSLVMDTLVLSIEMRTINIVLGIIGPAAMYLIWSLVYFTYHYFEQYNQSLQYEALIRDTELNNLRAQLNPHFIFNALNSIRALVDEDPTKSKTAITQLSNIIRTSLQVDRKKLVYFEEEMRTVTEYLSLESIRYEERLQVSLNIHPRTRKVNIPPMMIQTLVENGIKHGISQLKSGGEISVIARIEGDFLVIQIRNSGVYLDNKNEDERGFGLINTRKRIELIYGTLGRFSIKNEKNNVVLTEIVLPKATLQ